MSYARMVAQNKPDHFMQEEGSSSDVSRTESVLFFGLNRLLKLRKIEPLLRLVLLLWSCCSFIHGGAFSHGSTKDIAFNQVKWFLDHGVAAITIEYRLCPQ